MSRIGRLLASLMAVGVGGGCIMVGELRTESRSVELGTAESVRAEFRMGSGELKLRGGADKLLDAEFTYNVPAWKPEVEYKVSGGEGRLTVRQPNVRGPVRGKTRYEWDLRLKNGVPLDLSIHVGNGSSKLDLEGLSLTGLKVRTGNGSSKVNLAGNHPSLAGVKIGTGNGGVTADLTGDYGSLSAVDIGSGNGSITANLTGQYRSLSRLNIHSGNGSVTANLRGDWKRDVDATIGTGVGKVTVQLPSAVGVRVDVEKGVGKISGTGLRMDGKAFVNDAYGNSKVTLQVKVKAGVGSVVLDLAE